MFGILWRVTFKSNFSPCRQTVCGTFCFESLWLKRKILDDKIVSLFRLFMILFLSRSLTALGKVIKVK